MGKRINKRAKRAAAGHNGRSRRPFVRRKDRPVRMTTLISTANVDSVVKFCDLVLVAVLVTGTIAAFWWKATHP